MKMIFTESSTWDSEFKVGGHNYVKIFLRENWDVFWFSYPISLFHWFNFITASETRKRFHSWLNGVQKDGQLNTYVPFTLLPYKDYPLLRSRWVGSNTMRFTLPRIDNILKKNNFSKVDLICINNPTMLFLLDKIDYQKSVLRITDDMGSFKGNPDSIVELEEKAIQRVDTVFTTSLSLLDKLKNVRSDIYYLPNGVEYEFFAKSTGAMPPEYKDITSPRIIYVGAIDNWFDVGLLKETAKSLPDYSFILIGPIRTDVAELRVLPNIFLLGPRPHEQIPVYFNFADVGIIPFKKNALVDSVSPIKMYEFLAAGLPVVSTWWKELERVKPPIDMALDSIQFAAAIRKAYKKRSHNIEERKRFAKENSWEARFLEFKRTVGI